MGKKMIEKMIEEPKKVNLTELFYDLVFVFGISKITHVLHSLERGIFSLNEIIIYCCFCMFHKCLECADSVHEPLWEA